MSHARKSRVEAKTEAWIEDCSPRRRSRLLRHLALRGEPMAMTELSRVGGGAGRMSHPFSARNWAYRGVRGGDAVAAYNLAMDGFNRGDLQGYRRWLRRAARMGDEDAAHQLKRFETRLPHEAAYDSGRGRPWRRRD